MPVTSTRSEPAPLAPPIDRNGAIPQLEEGQRMTREEFERRYDAMPHLKRAELIEGVVHVPSPVRCDDHAAPHSSLVGCLFLYRARTPGTKLAGNASVRMDLDNMPQPDGSLFILPEYGGQARIDKDGYIHGAPDLIAEVSASSVAYDTGDKLEAYQRNRVRECIVWRVLDRQVDWYVLRGEGYEKLAPGEDGILRSTIFPGLWLDPAALVRDDCDTLLGALQRGLETPEHAAFKEKLQRDKIETKA